MQIKLYLKNKQLKITISDKVDSKHKTSIWWDSKISICIRIHLHLRKTNQALKDFYWLAKSRFKHKKIVWIEVNLMSCSNSVAIANLFLNYPIISIFINQMKDKFKKSNQIKVHQNQKFIKYKKMIKKNSKKYRIYHNQLF